MATKKHAPAKAGKATAKPAAKKPAKPVKKSAPAKKTAPKKAVAKKPVAKKPVAKKPTAKKPGKAAPKKPVAVKKPVKPIAKAPVKPMKKKIEVKKREPFTVTVDSGQLSMDTVDDMKSIFEHHRGEAEVLLVVKNGDRETKLRLGPDYRVRQSPVLRSELDEMLGGPSAQAA